ncbi:hypothetical protein G647_08443 [Cladophialophora carrionii CBS 160.54]|uniref:Uncharacterized protein n=1 Tax=Cladophialophora carrionii CBS 160.54 TaxID=1279043 RepID=V9D2B4_9EURO|nr:uncharacterized protein G647_08443 [Cladophialophora carrionii CBS 160.54]ETI20408.1 hypothetical protein G647_08443 [Cladophialophora carrionii CBS 160.54]
MPIAEQTEAVAAEGIASSMEHVEHVTSVGPWALRRDSNASWAAISSPGARSSRRGPISSTIASPGSGTPHSRNPFSDAFGASLVANDIHRNRDTSEASSSTAVGSSVGERHAQVVNGKSEFTRTIEEVDRQTEEIQHILDGEAIAASNDEAERRRYNEARAERPPRRLSRWSRPLALFAARRRRSSQSSIDTERHFANALHPLHADHCQACRQNSSVAMAGIYMLAITTVVAIPSPFILIKVLPDKSTPSSQLNLYLVMANPSAIFNSLLMIAWVVLAGLRWPAWREKSGVGFAKQWLVSLTVGLGFYFLVAGVLYACSK